MFAMLVTRLAKILANIEGIKIERVYSVRTYCIVLCSTIVLFEMINCLSLLNVDILFQF